MKNISIIFCILLSVFARGQSVDTDEVKIGYDSAYFELKGMLEGNIPLSFKRAVFVTENAYLNRSVSYDVFNSGIKFLAQRCRNIMTGAILHYEGKDKESVLKNFAVFKLMTDSNKYYIDSTSYVGTNPYTYDFDDFWGEKDWTNMFVIKLIETNKGNCHSLPFLYKILCEELGTKAYLAMAPNHTYIKQYAKSLGWYNTELTSGQFPIDAWVMASGYIHLSAIQNGVYMDTLSLKQSIAVSVTDLAKGYERKFPNDFDFIMQCTELALKYYPLYSNALILRAETLKKEFEAKMKDAGAQYPSDIFNIPEAKAIFDKMEKSYFHIHQIGYRMMPKEMYMNWLIDLKRHKEKYQNKEVSEVNPSPKK